jgi:hypothetical protein
MTVATWTEPEAPVGLGVWAAELRAAAELAASFALTAFVPESLRVTVNGKPDGAVDREATVATITAALLTGREVGLSPMAALRSIHLIHGTPAMIANTMRGLVLARGHDLWVVESTTTRCVYRGQRRGSSHVQEVVWTIDDARQMGIAGRTQWRAMPRDMLRARATGAICRLVAPEALLGLPYVVEELDDPDAAALVGDDPADTAEPKPRKRAARRLRPVVDAQLPPSPDTPTPPPTPPPDEQHEPPAPDVTPAQLRALHAAMSVAGIVERDDRLAYTSSVIGRDVTSSKELTAGEASAILDALHELVDNDPAPPPDEDGWPPVDDPDPAAP